MGCPGAGSEAGGGWWLWEDEEDGVFPRLLPNRDPKMEVELGIGGGGGPRGAASRGAVALRRV